MEDTIILSARPANDNARTYVPCDCDRCNTCNACGQRRGDLDGLCGECHADAAAELNGRRDGDEWLTFDE